jgi:Tfp pilus assembly protein PilX
MSMTDLLTPLKEVTKLLKERNQSNELIVSQAVERAEQAIRHAEGEVALTNIASSSPTAGTAPTFTGTKSTK